MTRIVGDERAHLNPSSFLSLSRFNCCSTAILPYWTGGKKRAKGGCREINKEAKRAAHMHHHVRAHFRLCRESISGIVGIVLQSAGRSCDRHAAPARVLIETSVAAIGMNRTKDTVPSNAL